MRNHGGPHNAVHRWSGAGGAWLASLENREPAHIPLEREILQRHRTPQRYNEGQGRKDGPDTPLLGVLAVAIGAGAHLAWHETKGGSDNQRGLSGHQVNQRRHVPIDETGDLIASNKVEGTAVYDRGGEKIGTVHNLMVGKRSGRVAYAVINFGGFLGFGGSYHPLPWSALAYDEDQGCYVVVG